MVSAPERTGAQIALEMVQLRRTIDRLEVRFSALAAEFATTEFWDEEGSVSAVDWIRFNCRLTGNAAADRIAVGRLAPAIPSSLEAVESGDIGFAHVAVMVRTAAAVGGTFDEARLLEVARHQSPGKFHFTCLHYRHAADPDGYAEEQARLAENRRLTLTTWEDGSILVNGVLDPVGGATVRTALEPLARRSGARDTRARDRRTADALVELAGGGEQPAQLKVTSSIETLLALAGAPAGELEFSIPVSSRTVERLACDSAVTRVLLGQESVVIDVGRSRRVVSPPVRRALHARDLHCTWPGCERPASMSAAHHVVHWTHGGRTDLDNLVLLCHRHHWMVHEGGWQLVKTDEGILTIPPTASFGPAASGDSEVVAPDGSKVVEDANPERDDGGDREIDAELVSEVRQTGSQRHVREETAEEDTGLERARDVGLEAAEDRVEGREQRDRGVAGVGDRDGDG